MNDDDFILVSSFKDLPKGIVFHYPSLGKSNAIPRLYKKVTKTHCWDGADKVRATNPSIQNCMVRVPRFLLKSYCKNSYYDIDSKALMELTLKHQNEN